MRRRLLTIIFGISSLSAAGSGFASPHFDAPWRAFVTGEWETGRYLVSVTAGDFDGDGLPDVAAGQSVFQGGIRVLRNLGDGLYGEPVFYETLQGAWTVVTADLDGDGDLDLAATDSGDLYQGSTIAIFRNHGDGSFGPRTDVPVGSCPAGLGSADLDGDGDLDLAATNYLGQGTISVVRNDGSGVFGAPTAYAVGAYPHHLSAGDLDGDQDFDLVVAHDEYQVSVLFNNGLGVFGAPVAYGNLGYPWGMSVESDVALADVEADGDLDVFYTNNMLYGEGGASPRFVLLRNDGSGTLLGPEEILYRFPFQNVAFDLETADLTGDGYPDVIGAQMYESGFVVLRNDGAGGFLPCDLYAGGASAIQTVASDVDGDLDLDVLTVNRLARLLTVHKNSGNGTFPERPVWGPLDGHQVVDLGDVDNDGDIDAVTSHDGAVATKVDVLRNLGNGTYAVSYRTPLEAYRTAKLRDLNGDGNLDLLFVSGFTQPPYDFFTALGNGDGTFGQVVRHPVYSCGLGHPEAFDIDADGDLDVLCPECLGCIGDPNGGQRVYISRNQGNGTFAAPYTVPTLPGLFPYNLTAADFNEDGRLDLATVGTIPVVILGNGDGSFQPAQEIQAGRAADNIVAADLDADGHMDLATLDIDENDETVLGTLRGDGAGGFTATIYGYPAIEQWGGWVAAGDVDSDGDIDLTTDGVQDALLFLNDGAGAFAFEGRYGLDKDGRSVHFADADEDEVGDLIAIATHDTPGGGFEQGVIVVRGLGLPPAEVTDGEPTIPQCGYILSFANPVSRVTPISLEIAETQRVAVSVHDPQGRRIRSLHQGTLAAGERHVFVLDGRELPSGIYFLKMEGESFRSARKVVIPN